MRCLLLYRGHHVTLYFVTSVELYHPVAWFTTGQSNIRTQQSPFFYFLAISMFEYDPAQIKYVFPSANTIKIDDMATLPRLTDPAFLPLSIRAELKTKVTLHISGLCLCR